ncbi:hypothetical protein QZH41_016368 [Actinostola sp. cb2023]|nr:hypothetical protein QZH41_016368 [Actinostola sp. cb2023]
MSQQSDKRDADASTEMVNLVIDDAKTESNDPGSVVELPAVRVVNGPDVPASSKTKSALIATIVVLCIACLIVGVVLLITAISRCKSDEKTDATSNRAACAHSEEAERGKLFEFLEQVREKFFELHPNMIVLDQSASLEKIKMKFQAYDSSPASIKKRTDSSLALLAQLNNMDIHASKLKTRERKLHSQIKFYLQHTFGQPYDGNYYTAGWMMGPNFFCWQPMCSLGDELASHLPLFAPKTVQDIHQLETIFQGYNQTIHQYIENLQLGIKVGMVRSVEECKAGLDVFKAIYRQIDLNNESGVLDQSFAKVITKPEFYKKLLNDTQAKWRNLTGKAVQDSVTESLVANVGVAMRKLLSYLGNEHVRHCVPSNVSSGLANRPLGHVYVDGVPTKPTTQSLPTGEKIYGNTTYASMMSYFTTTDVTPDEVYEMGWKRVKEVYKQTVAIAKEVTGLTDTDAAIKKFRVNLKSQSMFFNEAPLPKNESGPEAYRKCSTVVGAIKHCPLRWKAMQQWFKTSREIMSLLDPKTINMFFFTGQKHTTPNCPITLKPDFNPSTAAQSYEGSDHTCSAPCTYNIPFFLQNMGPSYSEWSVNAHEARPGHHTQIQGYNEYFRDTCGGVSAWLNQVLRFAAFSEGWGLYAEALIGQKTNAYEGRPLMKYGWLKWQMWRSLRLVVDTGLHSKGLTRQQALNLFDRYAWDDSDIPEKEVTRYQSGPGQATAYMIGEMMISKLRRYAEAKLGNKFDLRDFHFQVLSQGSAPLSFLISHIEQYVTCKRDMIDPGCHNTLSRNTPPQSSDYRTIDDVTVALPRFPYAKKSYL